MIWFLYHLPRFFIALIEYKMAPYVLIYCSILVTWIKDWKSEKISKNKIYFYIQEMEPLLLPSRGVAESFSSKIWSKSWYWANHKWDWNKEQYFKEVTKWVFWLLWKQMSSCYMLSTTVEQTGIYHKVPALVKKININFGHAFPSVMI